MSQSRTEADAVRAASDQFYDALEALMNGDASSMPEIWSHEDDVTSMNSGGGREEGWDAVSGTYEGFAAALTGGTVDRTDQVVRVTGDLAYELCIESASVTFAGEPYSVEQQRATNVYRKEDDEWKIVHHHADLDAEFIKKIENMDA